VRGFGKSVICEAPKKKSLAGLRPENDEISEGQIHISAR
jgi:hypothetical protein